MRLTMVQQVSRSRKWMSYLESPNFSKKRLWIQKRLKAQWRGRELPSRMIKWKRYKLLQSYGPCYCFNLTLLDNIWQHSGVARCTYTQTVTKYSFMTHEFNIPTTPPLPNIPLTNQSRSRQRGILVEVEVTNKVGACGPTNRKPTCARKNCLNK